MWETNFALYDPVTLQQEGFSSVYSHVIFALKCYIDSYSNFYLNVDKLTEIICSEFIKRCRFCSASNPTRSRVTFDMNFVPC